jgi:hypothetical protein
MSETHTHEPGADVGHGPYFSDEEWKHLQAADRSAAREVVTLLLSVFITGVILYSIVVYVVMP